MCSGRGELWDLTRCSSSLTLVLNYVVLLAMFGPEWGRCLKYLTSIPRTRADSRNHTSSSSAGQRTTTSGTRLSVRRASSTSASEPRTRQLRHPPRPQCCAEDGVWAKRRAEGAARRCDERRIRLARAQAGARARARARRRAARRPLTTPTIPRSQTQTLTDCCRITGPFSYHGAYPTHLHFYFILLLGYNAESRAGSRALQSGYRYCTA